MKHVLDLSEGEYAAAFRAFKAVSNERDLIASWFDRSIAGWVSEFESIDILSVGGGDGELDIRFIRSMIEKCSSVHYHVIEPSGPALSVFRKRVDALGSSRLHFSTDQSGFECYEPDRRFDLVHFIHSLIYIRNPLRELLRAMDMTSGSAMIVNQTRKGITELRQEFLPRIRAFGPETLASEEIGGTLTGAGYQLGQESMTDALDVTPCFEQDSREGMLLMSFFLLCRYDKLDPEIREEALDQLRDMTSSEDGRTILHNPVAALTISGNLHSRTHRTSPRSQPRS